MRISEKDRVAVYLSTLDIDDQKREEAMSFIVGYDSYVDTSLPEVDLELKRVQEYIDEYDLTKKTRKEEYIFRRYYIMFYARTNLLFSYEKIAKILKFSDHSTIINGIKNHKNFELHKDKRYKEYTKRERKHFAL